MPQANKRLLTIVKTDGCVIDGLAVASDEQAGTLDQAAIRDAIAATNMDTVMGHMIFNADGTGKVPFSLLQFQNGKPELVWSADFKTADFVYPAPAFSER